MMEAIPLDVVTQLIEAAETWADEVESLMVIVVVNSEGNPIAQHRMGGARLASVNISRNKAYTPTALDILTYELVEVSESGNSLYGLDTRNGGRMAAFGGGYPPERDGKVVGAIGISGGVVTQDRDVAEAGVECWTKLVETGAVPSDN